MIALAAAALAAVAPPPFTPPLGRDLVYRTVERHPLSKGGEVTLTSRQRLRFDREATGGLVATVTLDAVDVQAPPKPARAIRAAAEALLGVSIRVAIAPDGAPGTVLDPDAAWAAIARGYDRLDAALAADRTLTAADLATARTAIAAERARSPAARETRLQATVQPLLPPLLPALRPGEARPLSTSLAGPTREVPAHGTLQLADATDRALTYRSTIGSDPAPANAPASPSEQAGTDALAHATLDLASEIELDRGTGLVSHLHERRSMHPLGGGATNPIMDREITLER